jgi:hypothetical protein
MIGAEIKRQDPSLSHGLNDNDRAGAGKFGREERAQPNRTTAKYGHALSFIDIKRIQYSASPCLYATAKRGKHFKGSRFRHLYGIASIGDGMSCER